MLEKEQISNLKNNQSVIIGGGEGSAEIWRQNDMYFLFEIPNFGGMPNFTKAFALWDINAIINTVNSWT